MEMPQVSAAMVSLSMTIPPCICSNTRPADRRSLSDFGRTRETALLPRADRRSGTACPLVGPKSDTQRSSAVREWPLERTPNRKRRMDTSSPVGLDPNDTGLPKRGAQNPASRAGADTALRILQTLLLVAA